MKMADATINLSISRSKPQSRFETYTVPVTATTRILDAILHVQHHEDPTLGVRYACRVGMCGSCAIVINGREGLACQTPVASLGTRTIKVEPLRALPVQQDLMVDMRPFFDTIARSKAALLPKSPKLKEAQTMPPKAPHRALIEQQNGCITCGACHSACEWSKTHAGYLGPAALNRLLMLSLDERDRLGRKRLETAASEDGVLRCHTVGSCGVVCPAEIPLRTGMQRLKGFLSQVS
jgi:succinate dehydrogenase/fumarate reductase iron-sulfur protein